MSTESPSTMFRANLFRRIKGISPIQFLILLQLNEEPKYGYEILKTLREQFRGIWEPKTGTIYPALRRLEERGFVATEHRGDKDFYSLTDKGSLLLRGLLERLEQDICFADKYYSFVFRSLPASLKARLFIKWIERKVADRIPWPPLLHVLLDKVEDKDLKLRLLKVIRRILQDRLNFIEEEIRKIES
ncbi:hypothetical protein CP083_00650 [Candidatus Bathyarchaeota archaeon B24-2]|nr:MAG: hypothetical protein CP083_00650 [Candidatus Bathyarchaeota archaeon B24-2]